MKKLVGKKPECDFYKSHLNLLFRNVTSVQNKLSCNRKVGLLVSEARGLLRAKYSPLENAGLSLGSEGLGREAVETKLKERPPFKPWPASILVATTKATFKNFRRWHSLMSEK